MIFIFCRCFWTPTIWSLYKWVFLAFMKISNGDMNWGCGPGTWDAPGRSSKLWQPSARPLQGFSLGWYLGAFRYANKPCLSASHRSRKTVWIRCIFAMFAIICPNPGDFPWVAEPQSVEVLVVSPVVASYVLNSTWFARSGGLKHRFGESSHFWWKTGDGEIGFTTWNMM